MIVNSTFNTLLRHKLLIFYTLLPLVFVFQYTILFGKKHQFLTDDNNLGMNDKSADMLQTHTSAILSSHLIFFNHV